MKSMRSVYLLVATSCLLALAGPGCANFASFQEPDTMAKGQSRTGVGVTFTRYEIDEESSVSVPALNGWVRYGLMDNLEVHTLVWLPLGATAGVKYQLLGDRYTPGLSVAVGMDIGYLSITSGEGDNESSYTYIDNYVPVYVGYRVNPGFSAYAVPKFLFRVVSDEVGTEYSSNFGAAIGVALGEQTTLHLEGVMLYGSEGSLFTSGIGVAF